MEQVLSNGRWSLSMQVRCLDDLSAALCRRDIELQDKARRLRTLVQSWVQQTSQLTQAHSL